MASLRQKKGAYYVSFRWPVGRDGKRYERACKTNRKREADSILGRVDDMINRLQAGRDSIPEGVDVGSFIFYGGNVEASREKITLEEASEKYLSDRPDKEENTIYTERVHFRHLCRIVGSSTSLGEISQSVLRGYVGKRLCEGVSGATVRKELLTFGQVWEWGYGSYTTGVNPLKDPANPRKWAIKLPKQAATEPFRTWSEIERVVEKGGLSEEEAKPHWSRLYLDDSQVEEFIAFVRDHPKYSYLHLPVLLAARAGMRRSEIVASRCVDVNLKDGLIEIREKKRDKSKSGTRRRCILSASLKDHFETDSLDRTYTAVNPNGVPLTRNTIAKALRELTKGSRWHVLTGWHTLRHSFASICLRKGVPIHVTARWMGHTTHEMIELYQKTFIEDEQEFAKLLD